MTSNKNFMYGSRQRNAAVVSSPPGHSDEIQYVETDITEYCKNKFTMKRIRLGREIYLNVIRVIKTPNAIHTIESFAALVTGVKPSVIQMSDRYCFIENTEIFIRVTTTNQSIKIEISGDKDVVKRASDEIENEFDIVNNSVHWITSSDMYQVTIPLVRPKGIKNSSYPFIEDIDQFFDDFMTSTSNVLLLIGPPGTGKSNFIKHIVSKSGQDAMITYDVAIAAKDTLYGEFIESDSAFLIFEDAEVLLDGTRQEGNQYMHRFLNSSDGLISSKNKKIIFSTNLSSTDEIDPALLRSGRCFSVVTFRALSYDESVDFLNDHGMNACIDKIKPGGTYNLADLYAFGQKQYSRNQTVRTTGFY